MKRRLFVLVGGVHRGSCLQEFLRMEIVGSGAQEGGCPTWAMSFLPLKTAM